jgi:predicted Zn-dependent peptidase
VFGISGEVREGHMPEEVELAIYREMDRLRTEEVPGEELQKVKNNFAAYEYRRLASNMSILMQLIFNDGLGDWREINEAGPKHQEVTAADVKRVANTYFTKENRNVAIYTRKGITAPHDDPDLAVLSPDQKSVVRLLMARIKEESNADKLRESLWRLEEQIGKTDLKSQPFLQLQKKLIEQRLEEIK